MRTQNSDILYIDTEKYLASTSHLTLEQKGVLMKLRITMHAQGSMTFLDNPKEVSRILGCSKARWLKKLAPDVLPLLKDDIGVVS